MLYSGFQFLVPSHLSNNPSLFQRSPSQPFSLIPSLTIYTEMSHFLLQNRTSELIPIRYYGRLAFLQRALQMLASSLTNEHAGCVMLELSRALSNPSALGLSLGLLQGHTCFHNQSECPEMVASGKGVAKPF